MIISPSLLAADLLNIESEIISIEAAGADWLHLDVMDGHFVPNLSFGLPFIRGIKRKSSLPLDVHIMVSNPDQVALEYVEAGADYLTFHCEASIHPHRLIQGIQERGCKAGVAINPGSPLEQVLPLLPFVDLVLLMSVNPGFGGQSFINDTLTRAEEITKKITQIKRTDSVTLEIDGGVNAANIEAISRSGVNAVVAGSFVFGSQDRKQRILDLR